MGKSIDWNDEIIVSWLQKYPNIKQALVEILVRRYKNLLYKEIAKQCDKRYDREEIVQHIVYLFIQLLEEYEPERGIPLAGFLKNKLPNRIYNYFKTQVRLWTAEVQRDNIRSPQQEETNTTDNSWQQDTYEISQTQTEVHDFWVGVAKILDQKSFEALFWKFQCDYSYDEISILMGLRGPCEAEKFINGIIDRLRFDSRLFGESSIANKAITSSTASKQVDKKEILNVTYHLFQVLHREITNHCGVFDCGDETMRQYYAMLDAYGAGQDLLLLGINTIVDDIMHKCGLDQNSSQCHAKTKRGQ
jgi:DNA-directed RNA polymerase specialized sigma24 family protein